MMPLLYRLRRSVALFVCPELSAESRLKATMAEARKMRAPEDYRRFSFRTQEHYTGEPMLQAGRPSREELQFSERTRAATESQLQRLHDLQRERHAQSHGLPAEFGSPGPACRLRRQAAGDNPSCDRSVSHPGGTGDLP